MCGTQSLWTITLMPISFHLASVCETVSKMSLYDANNLYEDAYNISFNWQKWLKPDVYKYHKLLWQEFNSPVELQMGVLLPFVSSCCGPRTSGLWSTEPGILNLFWMNVAASGVGKSRARKKLISEPLKYMCANMPGREFPDFEVSRFTRAGEPCIANLFL